MAFRLNEEAAALGDHDAILAMGWFYNHGVGVDVDDEESRRWYRKAARHGDARAMFSLGAIAFEHDELEPAFRWLSRAVEAGHVGAHYWLGKLYWRGDGVRRDRREALRLFELAAEKKLAVAQRLTTLLPRLRKGA